MSSPFKTNPVCRECQCPPCLQCGKRPDDAVSGLAFSMHDSYYCEACKGDHKQKRCKECGELKSLTCYPESVREAVAKFRKIMDNHHWCTECIETKQKPNQPKVDWLSACIAKKIKKECISCKKSKTLDAYPEKIRAQLVKRKGLDHGEHACSKCIGEQPKL